MTTTPASIREHWTSHALKALPPESAVAERNTVISGTYAHWYLEHPKIYKWAGCAAFASHRVGLAIAPYEFIVDNGEVSDVHDGFGRPRSMVLDDLNLLRETNNNVYRDIGWTHLAYLAPDGGIAAIQKGLSDLPSHSRLVRGFELIHDGKKLLEQGSTRGGEEAIWKGNALLLEHEQRVTVQPAFDKFDKAFDVFLTVGTSMDFDADNLRIDWRTNTSFFAYMWTRGASLLLRTRSLPDVSRIDHRWFWVANRVYPLFREIDKSDRSLRKKLSTLAKRRRWQDKAGEAGRAA
jgi:hypothetical protein